MNKLYLSDNKNRDSSKPYIVIDKLNQHVFADEANCMAFGASVQDTLNKYVNGDPEILARRIVRGDIAATKVVMYCDRESYAWFQIWLWKSIFKNANTDFCYRLYKYSVVTERLRNFYSLGMVGYERSPEAIYQIIPFKRYCELYDSVPFSEILSKAPIDFISVEYLLPNYFIPEERDKVKDIFLKKISNIFWENWIDNYMRLRYEIVSCAMDIDQIDPSIHPDPDTIENAIKQSQMLSWISDPQFTADNRDYIQKTYDPSVFSETARLYYKANGIDEDPIRDATLVLGSQWEELLKDDIERGFGTRLVSQAFENKTNRVLVSNLYKLIKTNQTELLREYELNVNIQF